MQRGRSLLGVSVRVRRVGPECDPSDSLRTFGTVVQALREHAGFSRVEFGEVVRFSKHTVESVELGRRMPDESFVQRGDVTLQIVPLEAGLHACLDGPVRLLETPKGQRLTYSEGQQNGRLISDPKEVSLLYQRYDTLRSQAALTAKDSRGLLERLRGEL
ncbi:helix-turn-helix domain-containing protein [Streptomyces lomondensis]|uniref:helix-turn-helix domain-containing protein n=1 Tax=Streptomyces lomondensis TaxID=68229 RepID=UPI001671AD57